MAKIYKVALALLLPFSFAAAQQTITLRDGSTFEGKYTGGTLHTVTFVDQDGVNHRFQLRDIESLYFDHHGRDRDQGNYGNNSGNYNNGNNNSQRDNRNYRDNPANRPPGNSGYNANGNTGSYQQPYRGNSDGSYATLPANTQIAVRTTSAIHTNGGGDSGRTFPATIDQDVMDANGNNVIPRGSNATLVVRDIGNSQISLDLQSVNVNGQRYAMNTQDITQSRNQHRGVGANKRTGEYVGGGAVLGTLLGAIAGGGRGAAIGALAGAAAGAGTQVLTKGSEVKVPAETVLNFQLDQPVYLYQ